MGIMLPSLEEKAADKYCEYPIDIIVRKRGVEVSNYLPSLNRDC